MSILIALRLIHLWFFHYLLNEKEFMLAFRKPYSETQIVIIK